MAAPPSVALTLATLILTWGSISDLLGRKRVFIAGLAVFTVSSLLWTPGQVCSAQRVGYDSEASLSKAFSRNFGMAPR